MLKGKVGLGTLWQGIGRAIAVARAREGAKVALFLLDERAAPSLNRDFGRASQTMTTHNRNN